MAGEDKKPLKHMKFKWFSVFDADSLSGEQIRILYDKKKADVGENIHLNIQKLEQIKEKKSNEQKELTSQKTDLGHDPQSFYSKMQNYKNRDLAYLEARIKDKTSSAYTEKVAEIEAKYSYALDKDLLDTNQGAYVNKVMDAIEAIETQNNKEVQTEEIRLKAENNKYASQQKGIDEQKVLLAKNPELYAKLYEVKQGSQTSDDPARNPQISIKADAKGQPCLSVILQDARFPGGFIISEGRINFSSDSIDQMTLENMRYILDYLDRRGIRGIELPDGIDKKIEELYTQGQAANQAAEDALWNSYNKDENDLGNSEKGDENPSSGRADKVAKPQAVNEASDEVPSASGQAGSASGQGDANSPENHTDTTLATKKVDFNKTVDLIDDWVFGSGGLNKEEGWSAFHRCKWRGGWDCWAIYDQGNFNNEDLDGKVDKDGYMKTKYAFKIYARVTKDKQGNESLELRYAMPNGKKITDGYAKGLMRMLKKSGCTHVNFPDGLMEEDEGTFRIACASNGLVPLMNNLSESKIKKMLDEAESKLGEKELLEYKLKLAKHMRKCIKDSGEDLDEHKNRSIIVNLECEYEYKPFRNTYEVGDGLRSHLEHLIRDNERNREDGAVKIVAGAETVYKIFNIYQECKDAEVGEMLKANLNETQITAFEQNIQKLIAEGKLKGYNPQKLMRDMKSVEMGALFDAMLAQSEVEVREDLHEAYERNYNSSGRKEPDSQILSRIVSDASAHLRSVSGLLEDNNCRKIYCPQLGGRYDFAKEKEDFPDKGNNRGRHDHDDDHEF